MAEKAMKKGKSDPYLFEVLGKRNYEARMENGSVQFIKIPEARAADIASAMRIFELNGFPPTGQSGPEGWAAKKTYQKYPKKPKKMVEYARALMDEKGYANLTDLKNSEDSRVYDKLRRMRLTRFFKDLRMSDTGMNAAELQSAEPDFAIMNDGKLLQHVIGKGITSMEKLEKDKLLYKLVNDRELFPALVARWSGAKNNENVHEFYSPKHGGQEKTRKERQRAKAAMRILNAKPKQNRRSAA